MANAVSSGNEPNKGSRRTVMCVFVGVLLALLATFIFMSFAKQSKVMPGNTEARPSTILLTRY